MARQLRAGIDIGTSSIKAVIAEEVRNGDDYIPRIVGQGTAEARGLSHGYITNSLEVARCVREAVAGAEKTAGTKVKRAFVSVGGVGLGSVISTGSTVISRADMEITERDIQLAQEAAEQSIPQGAIINRRIINTIPVEYKVDGKIVWGRVEGLKASKLEVKTLFITCLDHHIQDLIRTLEEADIEVIDIVAAPIAASFVTLSKKQKKAGCMLMDLGAETLSIVVFENSTPVSLEVFPIGSNDITHDIALGLKVPIEEAESIKLGSITRTTFPKKKLEEIISARLRDCFELIENHLKKIGRNALLPAGVIITGGGAATLSIREMAESYLRLPAKVGEIHFGPEEKNKVKDTVWATAYGLTIVGFNAEDEQRSVGIKGRDILAATGKKSLRTLSDWISQFLP